MTALAPAAPPGILAHCASAAASIRSECASHLASFDEQSCTSKGCCWSPSDVPGSPWCHHVNNGATCDAILQDDREQCGAAGIWAESCIALGCCWRPDIPGSEVSQSHTCHSKAQRERVRERSTGVSYLHWCSLPARLPPRRPRGALHSIRLHRHHHHLHQPGKAVR